MEIPMVKVLGLNTKHITEDEILELIDNAEFRGESPEGMVKLVLKESGNKGDGRGFYGFQNIIVQANSRNGEVSMAAQLATDSLGQADSTSKLIFRKNRLGVNYAWIPLSKFNKNLLIQYQANAKGAPWKIQDKALNEEVTKKADRIRKAKEDKERRALEEAKKTVYAEKARLIKSLKETYGEGFEDVLEYKENILPDVLKEQKRILIQTK